MDGRSQGRQPGSKIKLVYKWFQNFFYLEGYAYNYNTFTKCCPYLSCSRMSLLNINSRNFAIVGPFWRFERFRRRCFHTLIERIISGTTHIKYVIREKINHKGKLSKGISNKRSKIAGTSQTSARRGNWLNQKHLFWDGLVRILPGTPTDLTDVIHCFLQSH